ncbi:MAG: MerR family transcriptional regulator [Anaplasmataceae bacterium]|nr:MerR family transcriptional regulator [Anaplasmataceae bacterium]
MLKNNLTIGQVAKLLNIETYVIRYWETQFNHLKPFKINKRRSYAEKDINNLLEVHDLLHIKGYSIKGAQKYLKEKTLSNDSDNDSNENIANTKDRNDIKDRITRDLKDIRESLVSIINKLQNAL